MDQSPERTRHGDDSRYAAKSGLLQMAFIMAQGIQPLYQLMVARLFGPAVYGLYGGALSIVEVLARLGLFGVDKAMYRFVAGHREKGELEAEVQALGTGLRLCLFIGGAVALVTFLGAESLAELFRRPAVAPFLRGLAPTMLAMPLVFTMVAAGLAVRAAHAPLIVRGLVEPLALTACALVAYFSRSGWTALAIAHSVAWSLTAGVALWFVGPAFGHGGLRRALAARRHPELVRFARPIALLEVVNTLRQQADSIIVLAFLPLEAAAFYKASDHIGRVAAQIRNAFDGVAAPLFAGAIHVGDRQRLAENLRFLTRWVATLTLPLGTSLIALRLPLLRLFGPEYVAAGTIVIVHVIGHMANGILGLGGYVLAMSGKARFMTINQVVALAANVLLSFLLIPRLGFTGAVIGFAAAMAVVVVGNVAQTYVQERVSPFHRALLKPFVAAGACLAVQLAIAGAVETIAVVIPLGLVAGLLVYLAVWWALGPGAQEREVVLRVVARLRRKSGDRKPL